MLSLLQHWLQDQANILLTTQAGKIRNAKSGVLTWFTGEKI